MCGITGFWELNQRFTAGREKLIVQQMTNTLRRRGPDDEGLWVDEELGLALGHRRLQIIDLSPLGHQPMRSASGNSAIIFNGEIYNFQELRQELIQKNISFKGQSDTEVLLEACELYGVEKAVKKCIGMFAFALWKVDEKKLYLCRDRLGVKPLYWGIQQGVLFFGSQLSSFSPHPAFNPSIDMEALGLYFKYNYVPAPYSIFQNIRKLQPGHLISIDASQKVEEKTYWSVEKALHRAQENPYQGSYEEATEETETLLQDAVGKRMIADVPLGCFLSGGIDSSMVAALMQSQSSRPIKTFSIGFQEKIYDEAPYAKAIAYHLGTDHTESYCSVKDCISLVPQIPSWFDEPFGDASQLPTYLVSKMAREHVTVALSGDGGDELFAGYNRYKAAAQLQRLKKIPRPLRQLGKKFIGSIPSEVWQGMEKARIFPLAQLKDKSHKIEKLLDTDTVENLYDGLVSFWDHPSSLLKNSPDFSPSLHPLSVSDPVLYMQVQDMLTYLPDDILTKVDRASMAVSLEAREPLLDHRLVEWSLRLPTSFKIHQGRSKRILRDIAEKHIPASLLHRPKQGFAIPLEHWLRSDLREWAEDLLSPDVLAKDGFLNSFFIQSKWEQFKKGEAVNAHALWGILMFQAWYKQFKHA